MDLKIDVEEMEGGKALMDTCSGGYSGLLWLAILRPDGSVAITSDDPERGNIGSTQAGAM